MIYLDAAATSFYKPKSVEEAMISAMHTASSAGRGGHPLALQAQRILLSAREEAAALFRVSPELVCFSQNATESLNTAIDGLFSPQDHLITTASEHNSVLRPLYRLADAGMELSILPADAKGRLQLECLPKLLRKNTKAVVCTHASNVTGNCTDLKAISAFCKEHGLLLLVDAAQTAGAVEIDLEQMGIDLVAFTGHKGLYGPQGTGGLCMRRELPIRPLMVGGSGIHSFDRTHPSAYPMRLEAGTQNTPGIAGLGAGIAFVRQTGVAAIAEKEQQLASLFLSQIRTIPGILLYGDLEAKNRTAIVSLNLGDLSSGELADWLAEEYGICVRAGAHCAPLMHQALGTEKRGVVRFSFSYFNTVDEVQKAAEAIFAIAKEVG